MSASFDNYINLRRLNKQRIPIQMICYKDRTWCIHSRNCSNVLCDRNLIGDDIEKAIEWWGGLDFPVCYVDFKTEECGFIPIEIKGDELLEKLD